LLFSWFLCENARLRFDSYTELSVVNIKEIRNQENQLDLNLLISVKSSVYYLNGHADKIQDTEKYFCDWFCYYNFLSLLLTDLQFIEIDLTREYQLNNFEKIKSILNVQNFLELLQYYWFSNTNMFAAELQRVQLISIFLATAFTDFRFSVFLTTEYCNLNLFLLRDFISKLFTIIFRVILIKIKDQTKRKKS